MFDQGTSTSRVIKASTALKEILRHADRFLYIYIYIYQIWDSEIYRLLCLYSSASLDEGTSGASVLSGQVQSHCVCSVSLIVTPGGMDGKNDCFYPSAFTAYFFMLLRWQLEDRSVRFRAKVARYPPCSQPEWRSKEEQVPEKGLSKGTTMFQ